jgi:hypothetical protein
MIGQGKLIGGVLIGAGIVLAGIILMYGFANTGPGGSLDRGSMGLVGACALLVGAILGGAGIFFFVTGQSETRSYAEVEKEKHVLNAVQTQGQVSLSALAVEMNTSMDQIRKYVYDLVGKGLFTGYVDWKAGKLISSDAASLANTIQSTGKCPNCGAPLGLGGKGLIKCEYCGAEFFLSSTPGGPAPAAPAR